MYKSLTVGATFKYGGTTDTANFMCSAVPTGKGDAPFRIAGQKVYNENAKPNEDFWQKRETDTPSRLDFTPGIRAKSCQMTLCPKDVRDPNFYSPVLPAETGGLPLCLLVDYQG